MIRDSRDYSAPAAGLAASTITLARQSDHPRMTVSSLMRMLWPSSETPVRAPKKPLPDTRQLISKSLAEVSKPKQKDLSGFVYRAMIRLVMGKVKPFGSKIFKMSPKDYKTLKHVKGLMNSHIEELFEGTTFLGIDGPRRGEFLWNLATEYLAVLESAVSPKGAVGPELKKDLNQLVMDLTSAEFFDGLIKALGPDAENLIKKLFSLGPDGLRSDQKTCEFWSDLVLGDLLEAEFNPEYGNEKNLKYLLQLANEKGLIKNYWIIWLLGFFVSWQYKFCKSQLDSRVDSYIYVKPKSEAPAPTTALAIEAAPAAPPQPEAEPTASEVIKTFASKALSDALEMAIQYCGVEDLYRPKLDKIADVAVDYIVYFVRSKVERFVVSPVQPSLKMSLEEWQSYADQLDDASYGDLKKEVASATRIGELSASTKKQLTDMINDDYGFVLWMIHQAFRIDPVETEIDKKHFATFNKTLRSIGHQTITWDEYIASQNEILADMRGAVKSYMGISPAQ